MVPRRCFGCGVSAVVDLRGTEWNDPGRLRLERDGDRWCLAGADVDRLRLVDEYLGHLADCNYSPKTLPACGFDLVVFGRWRLGEDLGSRNRRLPGQMTTALPNPIGGPRTPFGNVRTTIGGARLRPTARQNKLLVGVSTPRHAGSFQQ